MRLCFVTGIEYKQGRLRGSTFGTVFESRDAQMRCYEYGGVAQDTSLKSCSHLAEAN